MRFNIFSTLLASPALASAVSITSAPLVAHTGDSVTVSWNNGANDPKWTLFLVNATTFPSLYDSWEDIDSAAGSLAITLKSDLKPGSDYQFRAVQANWVDFVLSFGPQFSVVP